MSSLIFPCHLECPHVILNGVKDLGRQLSPVILNSVKDLGHDNKEYNRFFAIAQNDTKTRCAQRRCHSEHTSRFGCALVGGKAEMVAVEVEKLGCIDDSYSRIFLEIIHQKPYIIHKHGLG